jgi:rhodanese-related sulfurtransferase
MKEAVSEFKVLSRLQPFSLLGEDSLRELLHLCRYDRFSRDRDPMAECDWAGRLVYLSKGELKVNGTNGSLDVLVGGTGRALLPIFRDGRKPPVTKAITDIELLSLDEEPLDVVVTWDQLANPAAGAQAKKDTEATDWRQMSGMFAIKNLTNGAFAALPPANIETLLDRFSRISVKRGSEIVRQGELGDYYYLIERGRCRVTRLVAGTPMEVAELKEGDAFGEEALVADTMRNATVTMKTDGILLRLSKEDFVSLLREPLLQRIAPADAMSRVAKGAQWIDVRFPVEFQQDGLPGAINIPLNDVRQTSIVLDAARDYIVYCQTGRRSSAAAFLLSQRGVRAALLDGGLKALNATMEQPE